MYNRFKVKSKKEEMAEEYTERNKWKHILKGERFFAPFGDDELDELIDAGEVKKYAMNEFIIREDSVDYTFYVILQGKVSIIKDTHARTSRNIASLTNGHCFGEMAMLLDGHRSASVLATIDCVLYKISGKEIEKMRIETQLKLFRQFAIMLAIRLKETSVTVSDQF